MTIDVRKVSIVSWHVPQEEGSATGRALWATCEGLRSSGIDVDVRAWGRDQQPEEIPSWCTWTPVPREAPWRTKARALVRPRSDVTRIGWRPRPGAVALAYEPTSFAAVERWPRSAVVLQYSELLDAEALRDRSLKRLQDRRAERRAVEQADVVVAYSERVAGGVSARACTVPIPYAPPADPVPLVGEPVALMFANWHWRPNQIALDSLLATWRRVVERQPAARLLLAGRGFDRRASDLPRSVEVLGEVPRSRDALERAAALVFPCPASSGPKIKVLEAMSYGVPVVTTAAGAEGIAGTHGKDFVISDRAGFADAVADILGDVEQRAAIARSGRQAVIDAHAPRPAAAALVAAIEQSITRRQ